MKNSDARIQILRERIDVIVDEMLDRGKDTLVDTLDHYLLGTLRAEYIDIEVYNRVYYYVNVILIEYIKI